MFWNIEFDSAHVSPAPELAWQAVLKKTKAKLHPVTDIDMLLMVKKYINNQLINVYTNNKYMKDYDKNKESSHLNCWDINNLYGRAMLQKLHATFTSVS